MSVKDIYITPIKSEIARNFVSKFHYSKKSVQNSQLHFGCFLNGFLGGVMSFGPCMDKKKMMGLVRGTKFNDFMELNRMAFSDLLPKNSESRCLSVALKLIKKNYPNIKWIISFADACQCGDGTIYRAAGFLLTGYRKNQTIYQNDLGERIARISIHSSGYKGKKYPNMGAFLKEYPEFKKIPGFMLRYIFFLDKEKQKDLTVPILPYKKIYEIGAGMYKGKRKDLRVGLKGNANQCADGGVIPTPTLHLQKA